MKQLIATAALAMFASACAMDNAVEEDLAEIDEQGAALTFSEGPPPGADLYERPSPELEPALRPFPTPFPPKPEPRLNPGALDPWTELNKIFERSAWQLPGSAAAGGCICKNVCTKMPDGGTECVIMCTGTGCT